ncbi:14045_t:CDS:10 [Entrophospora sp. SA101]|nr:14045_t:CDS:10 [Entrophospora sp. SA101]
MKFNAKTFINLFNLKKKNKRSSNEKKWLDKAIKQKRINLKDYSIFSDITYINKGASGQIYRAKWNNVYVALKEIKDDSDMKRFVYEFRSHKRVDYHDNILNIHGITKDPNSGNYLLVLQYANHGTLQEYLSANADKLDWENKLRLAYQLASGIQTLHHEGIIHRDLHLYPYNIRENKVDGTPEEYFDLYTRCWDAEPDNRPDIKFVVECLEELRKHYTVPNSKKNSTNEHLQNASIDPNNYLDLHELINRRDLRMKQMMGGTSKNDKYISDYNNNGSNDVTVNSYSQLYNSNNDNAYYNSSLHSITMFIPLSLKFYNKRSIAEELFIFNDHLKTFSTKLNKMDEILLILQPSKDLKEWLDKEKAIIFPYSIFSDIAYINEGASGKIYRAKWKSDIDVALKEIKDDVDSRRFIYEFSSHKQVDYDDSILNIYGVTQDPDSRNYLLVLQFANHGTLHEYLSVNADKLYWGNKLRLAYQLASGIQTLHQEGIIHRDLHARNILVVNNNIKISDFGLSGSRKQVYGNIKYTDLRYPKDEKSDIFSLGVLLWQISSCKPPYESIKDVRDIHLNNLRETKVDGTPEVYFGLYTRCWDPEPNNRPDIKSVVECLDELRQHYYTVPNIIQEYPSGYLQSASTDHSHSSGTYHKLELHELINERHMKQTMGSTSNSNQYISDSSIGDINNNDNNDNTINIDNSFNNVEGCKNEVDYHSVGVKNTINGLKTSLNDDNEEEYEPWPEEDDLEEDLAKRSADPYYYKKKYHHYYKRDAYYKKKHDYYKRSEDEDEEDLAKRSAEPYYYKKKHDYYKPKRSAEPYYKKKHDYYKRDADAEAYYKKKHDYYKRDADAEAYYKKKHDYYKRIGGALRIRGVFLSRYYPYAKKIYSPKPTWGNHNAVFKDYSLEIDSYRYYDKTNGFNFNGLLGVDPTQQQW